MTIFFLTRQPRLCCSFKKNLEDHGHNVWIYTDALDFYIDVRTKGPDEIDLLAIDFLAYDHDVFNPFQAMKLHKCAIPLIYYNDPYPSDKTRLMFWRGKMLELMRGAIKAEKVDSLLPVMKLIDSMLKDEKIRKYVPLINQPEDFRNPDAVFNAELFCTKHKLAVSRKKLIQYFASHINRSISLTKLSTFLWNDFTEKSRNNLYTYIHDLKNELSGDEECLFKLEKSGKGSYVFCRKDLPVKIIPEDEETSDVPYPLEGYEIISDFTGKEIGNYNTGLILNKPLE